MFIAGVRLVPSGTPSKPYVHFNFSRLGNTHSLALHEALTSATQEHVCEDGQAKSHYTLADIALHDSKKLKEHERYRAFGRLQACPEVLAYVLAIPASEIDRKHMAAAWKDGMESTSLWLARMYAHSTPAPALTSHGMVDGSPALTSHVMVDGGYAPPMPHLQRAMDGEPGGQEGKDKDHAVVVEATKKGDSRWRLMSAASILAKTARDVYMQKVLALELTSENDAPFKPIFEREKGYGSKRHMELVRQGKCTAYHRKSFNPLAKHFQAHVMEEVQHMMEADHVAHKAK